MHRYIFSVCLVILLNIPSIPLGIAAVIYDNGAPSPVSNNFISEFDGPQQMADNFTLNPGSNTITDVHWYGAYSDVNGDGFIPAEDDFTVRIYEDNGGAPELSPTILDINVGDVGRSDTGDTSGSLDRYVYSVDIAPLTLTPGRTYWLSIVNNTGTDIDVWGWADSVSSPSNRYWRTNEGDAWNFLLADRESAFFLTDDNLAASSVPVPAAVWLFTPALCLVMTKRRKWHTLY